MGEIIAFPRRAQAAEVVAEERTHEVRPTPTEPGVEERTHEVRPTPAEVVAEERTHEARPTPTEPGVEPLWRETIGDVFRGIRTTRGERLADVARRAGVSVQYLSEVERGRKEPSSEMIAAIAGAHDLSLHDLALTVAERLARPASGAVLQAA